MSAFYFPFDFDVNDVITITDEEFKHIKVQRKLNRNLKITNGLGLVADATPLSNDKNSIQLKITSIYRNHNENKVKSTLFFGLIDDKNRIEFILEKATELGVNEIYPLICENTQLAKFDLNRSIKKAISAIKQSERAILPKIYSPLKFEELKSFKLNNKNCFLADKDGIEENIKVDSEVFFFVGPEGGFSNNELDFLTLNCKKVKLGNAVLRTETACISIFQKVLI